MKKNTFRIMMVVVLFISFQKFSYGWSVIADILNVDFSHVSSEVVDEVKKGGLSVNVTYPGQYQGTLFSNYWSKLTGITLRYLPVSGVTLEFWIWTDKDQEEIRNSVTKHVIPYWNRLPTNIKIKVGNDKLGTNFGYVDAVLLLRPSMW